MRVSAILGIVALTAVVVTLLGTATAAAPKGADPYRNFNFRVEIDGVDAGHFDEIDGLAVEVEVYEGAVAPGGDPVTRKRPGRVKYGDITLKRGYFGSSAILGWIKDVERDGEKARRRMHLVIEDAKTGDALKTFNFFDCFPTRWQVSGFDGKGNDVLTEEVVIAVEHFEEA